jgi:S-adenosylmethionine:tRNA ribosyltransferase-isomerase
MRRDTGRVEHRRFVDVLDILQAGDLLISNDTRVSAVRLMGEKATGATVEALLLSPLGDDRYRALVKPGKRLRTGARIVFEAGLEAEVTAEEGEGIRVLAFPAGTAIAIRQAGTVPLPPYIHERLNTPERYQTVYAAHDGSAAAPTAGLHFTPSILSALAAKGVQTAHVTLHVGIDTFRPVAVENLDDHVMHGEELHVPPETVAAVANCPGRVIAVGTTSVRTLESMAMGPRDLRSGSMVSKLFIRPGYEFQIVDGMFTNLHLPRTTMMTMLSAMVGRDALMSAYQEAIREEYRFLSFGDSMLIL